MKYAAVDIIILFYWKMVKFMALVLILIIN